MKLKADDIFVGRRKDKIVISLNFNGCSDTFSDILSIWDIFVFHLQYSSGIL